MTTVYFTAEGLAAAEAPGTFDEYDNSIRLHGRWEDGGHLTPSESRRIAWARMTDAEPIQFVVR